MPLGVGIHGQAVADQGGHVQHVGRTWLAILALFLTLPVACVISVAALYGLAWPDRPDEVFSLAVFDVEEIVPWIVALALLSMNYLLQCCKAAVAIMSYI